MTKYLKYALLPFGLSLFALVIYLYTAPPAMSWEDALNFVDASVTLGVTAPPAPLYVLIGHLFTLLPVGSYVFRLQLLSALLAAGSLLLLYMIAVRVSEKFVAEHGSRATSMLRLAGAFSVLALAFSYEFWSQAQNPEIWTLECLFEVLVLFVIIVVMPARQEVYRWLLVIIVAFGLATGTDPVVLSFLPSIVLVIWMRRSELSISKLSLLAAAGLTASVVAYSYLPIAAAHNPFLNWGRPTTLSAIWAVATGQGMNSGANGFTGSSDVFFASVGTYFYMLWMSFTPLLLPFVLGGAWRVLKSDRKLFWLLSLIVITNFTLSILYKSGNQESWYLLSDIVFAIYAGTGYIWATQKLRGRWYVVFLFTLSLAPLVYWWGALDRRGWRITDDYMHNFYSSMKEPAIVFGSSDLFFNDSYFAHDVSNYRTGVIPVLPNLYTNSVYNENLKATTQITVPEESKYYPLTADNYSKFVNDFFAINLSHYKIYVDYPALHTGGSGVLSRPDGSPSFRLDMTRFKLIPTGLASEVVPASSNAQPELSDFAYQFSNGFPAARPTLVERVNNDQLNNLVSQYVLSYITAGDYYLKEGESKQALALYKEGYAVDSSSGAILSKLGIYYVKNNQPEKAIVYFKQGAERYPNDLNWAFSVAVADAELGNMPEAMTLLQQVISHTAVNSPLNVRANGVVNKIESMQK